MAAQPALARIQTIDAVRGVAVMGILLLNIIAFSMPQAAYMNPRAYGGADGANLLVYLVNFILFDGKMRGLFSFLFGASTLLVIEHAEAKGESAARVHFLRMAWLLVFGLAHLYFVWWGDILSLYAPVGMIAFFFRDQPVAVLLRVGAMLILLQSALMLTIPLDYRLAEIGAAQHQATAMRHLADYRNQFGVPAPETIARDLALFRGSYAGIVADRIGRHLWSPVQSFFFVGLETLGYMLFGMAAFRSGLFSGDWERKRYLRWIAIGFGLSLPAYAALATYLVRSGFSGFSVALGVAALPTLVRPPMILGWGCLIVLLARSGGALTRRLAAAGRMAFTNYLVTSLICTALFYGYGLGWYGDFERAPVYLVVLALWAAMLLWSRPWLERFRYGPFEWLWRSLARGRFERMTGGAYPRAAIGQTRSSESSANASQ